MIAALRTGRRGFTLIELIATIVVLAIIGGIGSSIILNNADAYLQASTTSQLHQELSVAMDRIVRELRRINLDSGAAASSPHIDTVTDTSIDWRDTDGDAYELTLVGTELRLGFDGGTARALLTEVSAFDVNIYDEDNAAVATPCSGNACDVIRRIEVSISLTRQGITETLSAKAFLRATLSGS